MRNLWYGKLLAIVVTVPVLFALAGPVSSEDKKEEKQRTFVGAAKCKTCHKSEKRGQQYVIWQNGPHAKAYETLAGDEAKAIAKERGIEDPQKADECLKCHVTAHGVDAACLGTKYAVTDGVGCESCHGPGGDYYKSKTMKALASGEITHESVGMITPDEKTCKGCHNEESPTYKEFVFEKMVAKIAHPIPAEVKAKYKKTKNE